MAAWECPPSPTHGGCTCPRPTNPRSHDPTRPITSQPWNYWHCATWRVAAPTPPPIQQETRSWVDGLPQPSRHLSFASIHDHRAAVNDDAAVSSLGGCCRFRCLRPCRCAWPPHGLPPPPSARVWAEPVLPAPALSTAAAAASAPATLAATAIAPFFQAFTALAGRPCIQSRVRPLHACPSLSCLEALVPATVAAAPAGDSRSRGSTADVRVHTPNTPHHATGGGAAYADGHATGALPPRCRPTRTGSTPQATPHRIHRPVAPGGDVRVATVHAATG